MSLFVHPENQKIIWNIINGNPYIIRYFESKPHQAKETWFRKSIEDFYTRIQGKEIDPNDLNNLNKEVLTELNTIAAAELGANEKLGAIKLISGLGPIEQAWVSSPWTTENGMLTVHSPTLQHFFSICMSNFIFLFCFPIESI